MLVWGFGVSGLGFDAWGSELKIQNLEFEAPTESRPESKKQRSIGFSTPGPPAQNPERKT